MISEKTQAKTFENPAECPAIFLCKHGGTDKGEEPCATCKRKIKSEVVWLHFEKEGKGERSQEDDEQ